MNMYIYIVHEFYIRIWGIVEWKEQQRETWWEKMKNMVIEKIQKNKHTTKAQKVCIFILCVIFFDFSYVGFKIFQRSTWNMCDIRPEYMKLNVIFLEITLEIMRMCIGKRKKSDRKKKDVQNQNRILSQYFQ